MHRFQGNSKVDITTQEAVFVNATDYSTHTQQSTIVRGFPEGNTASC